jgi:heme/copper-type cytochrome/quinol oxidase subunit 1
MNFLNAITKLTLSVNSLVNTAGFSVKVWALLWLPFNTLSVSVTSLFQKTNSYSTYKNTNLSLSWITTLFRWAKVRVSYALNSWIYTTNHKRIAINYFNFVLVAGTAGMSLATIIRLEFAYPGVGILAGDSIQYLSIATAHGVIMVFFMIMPVVFGAFGNFLLPTQLGVHDVAFPRLNSAAFWFLPGGLIMLCQLVCVDRRYQRMNCFNIRELQGILKRKFFTDLVNSNDHRNLFDKSIIGLRFKNNNQLNINHDMSLFYNFGTTTSAKTKYTLFSNNYSTFSNSSKNTSTMGDFTVQLSGYIVNFTNSLLLVNFSNTGGLPVVTLSPLYNTISNILNTFSGLLSSIISATPLALTSIVNLPRILNEFVVVNLSLNFYNTTNESNLQTSSITDSRDNAVFTSENITSLDSVQTFNSSMSEISTSLRFTRFNNPLISYDYKCGNYLGIWDQLYPSLMTSFIEVARGIRKAPWFYSDQFVDLLKNNYKNFNMKFTTKSQLKLAEVENWYSSHVAPVDNFFNTFYLLKQNNGFINLRWVSINSLDQKFYKMFDSSSTQQRILANWRQLKFTREAWRCKLLAARHQNSLYRRFTSEDGLVYSIERNAKDLLPGWAMVTPFSARTRFTAIGKVDVGLMGVFLAINASIVSSANFLVTYRYLSTLNNRKMRDARSFFAEGLITASWMMVAANPMLAIGILMLLSDRHWQTSFFDYSGGGDTVLFQHMFWFFGHPEVYIIMLPVFGFTNTMMSFYLRKRVSARASLLYSMYTIAFLGFFVWGHHMYMVGLSHTTRMLFSTLTVMISVPAATKLMHWCVTIVNSAFVMELPFLFTFTFVFFFVSGGVSGMAVAHTGMDVLFHDTFYVIGHFHVMFAGAAMLGIFGAFYFYFPAIYGVKYSRIYAYIHYVYYLFGQLLTVIPMFWLGYCGMPRRVLDYPSSLGGWHSIASAGHLLSVAALLSFFIMMYDSIRQAKPAIRNNFGVGRFNTRLNFYFYEINRLSFIQRKSFHNHRYGRVLSSQPRELNHLHLDALDSTLFSYQFVK